MLAVAAPKEIMTVLEAETSSTAHPSILNTTTANSVALLSRVVAEEVLLSFRYAFVLLSVCQFVVV